MKRFSYIFLLCLSLALASWGESRATTWVVAKDGSGDYSVIQDALDVCAAGDTVRIRSGRYEDFRVHTFDLGGTGAVIMIPKVTPLTILGADRDSVVIGPQVLTTSYGGYQTGALAADVTTYDRIYVSGITMENCEWLASTYTPHSFIDCKFGSVHQAGIALISSPDVVVQGCIFDETGVPGSPDGIASFVGGSNPRLRVTDCTFRNLGTGITTTGAQDFELSHLVFEGVAEALSIQYGSVGTITDCRIGEDDAPVYCIVLLAGSQVTMENVYLASSVVGISLDDANTSLTGNHLHLEGASYTTVYVATGASLTLRDCDILNGGGTSVMARDLHETAGSVDVRNCYWGTTDSLQVEEWLFDGKDDPKYKEALFWPIRETPVPLKAESVGGLKALFHGGH